MAPKLLIPRRSWPCLHAVAHELLIPRPLPIDVIAAAAAGAHVPPDVLEEVMEAVRAATDAVLARAVESGRMIPKVAMPLFGKGAGKGKGTGKGTAPGKGKGKVEGKGRGCEDRGGRGSRIEATSAVAEEAARIAEAEDVEKEYLAYLRSR
jgi:hypothetical protein